MKVQVLSIQPASEPNTHQVWVSVGTDTHKFIFTTEVNQVGEQLLQTIAVLRKIRGRSWALAQYVE